MRKGEIDIAPIPFNVIPAGYASNQTIDSMCNAIAFINQGTNVVMIDQVVKLVPGAVYSIGGNIGEMVIRQFPISFVDTGGTSYCVVVRKEYE